jgi:hypothetical protein
MHVEGRKARSRLESCSSECHHDSSISTSTSFVCTMPPTLARICSATNPTNQLLNRAMGRRRGKAKKSKKGTLMLLPECIRSPYRELVCDVHGLARSVSICLPTTASVWHYVCCVGCCLGTLPHWCGIRIRACLTARASGRFPSSCQMDKLAGLDVCTVCCGYLVRIWWSQEHEHSGTFVAL